MKITPYTVPKGINAIIIEGWANEEGFLNLLLDTGASHTSLDSNALAISSIQLSQPVDKVLVETANGVISTNVYLMDSLESLGIYKSAFPVQIIDFIERGITSEYDGIIGLDFLAGTHFCIDTVQQQITIQ